MKSDAQFARGACFWTGATCRAGADEDAATAGACIAGSAFCSIPKSNGLGPTEDACRESSVWLALAAKNRAASSRPGLAACAVRKAYQDILASISTLMVERLQYAPVLKDLLDQLQTDPMCYQYDIR